MRTALRSDCSVASHTLAFRIDYHNTGIKHLVVTLSSLRRQPIRYTAPLPSSLVNLTTKPSFFFSTPDITPLTV